MDLLVDGQPLQTVGRPAITRIVLRSLAELARRPGYRIEVVENATLPPLDRAAAAPLSVLTFTPPPELAGRPEVLALYFADWMLARQPTAVLVPGLPPRGSIVPHFVGRAPRLLAVVDPAEWARAVEALAADPAAAPISPAGLNLALRAEQWFDYVPAGSQVWTDETDCGIPARSALTLGFDPAPVPPPSRSLPAGLAGKAFLLLDGARLSPAEVRDWLTVHASLPPDFRARHPLAVIVGDDQEPAGPDVVLVRHPAPDERAALFAWCRAVVHSFREVGTLALVEGLTARRPAVIPAAAFDPRLRGVVHPLAPAADPAATAAAVREALASGEGYTGLSEIHVACPMREAADSLHDALTRALAKPVPDRRKRIAWVMPPDGDSAVSGWARELASAMTAAYEVDLVSFTPEGTDRAVLTPNELLGGQSHRPHDLVVYHLGNHPRYALIPPLARALPGLVIVHDSDLDRLAPDQTPVAPTPTADDRAGTLATDSLLACCSPHALRHLRTDCGQPAVILPRGVRPLADRPVGHARLQLNLTLGLFLVGVWTADGDADRVAIVFQAVAALPASLRDRVRVVVLGEASAAEQDNLRQCASDLGLAHHALWHCDEDPAADPVFARALDVCVALGGSRDGEAALRVLGCLAAGTVCIAPDGAAPTVPADPVTVRINPDDLVDGTRRALEELIHSTPLRHRLGEAGRAFVAGEASADRAAAHLHGLIEQLIRDRAAADADWKSAVARADSAGLPDQFLSAWSDLRRRATVGTASVRPLRYVLPAPPAEPRPARVLRPAAGRRLWVNMSHILAGHRGHYTGISRMVVSVTREMVRHRMASVRYCRVYENRGTAFLTEVARDAAERHISTDVTAPAADLDRHTTYTPVDFQPGDILFCPEVNFQPAYLKYLRLLRRHSPVAIVPFVHDVIAAKYPHYFGPNGQPQFWPWAMTAVATADLILVNSNHTAGDVRWFAGANSLHVPPIEVVRLGDEDLAHVPTHHLKGVAGLTPADRFALVCCTVEVRKNHRLLYEVWRRLLATHGPTRTPKLICVGRVGWMVQELMDQLRADPHTREHVILLENVDDAGLAWLYKHCLFTLYPSLYEGWGMPVGEGLAAGKFAVVSNSSSIPEIGGDLVDYHDPVDALGCLAAVERAAFDDAYRARREARIRAEYRGTSWYACARQIVERLERHLGPLAPAAPRARRWMAA